MKDTIEKATDRAIKHYGDKITVEFYQRLKENRFCTTRCLDCGRAAYPPRPFCPYCLSEGIEWMELSGKGKIYAFTQQERSLRFYKPDVIGLVELEEGIGKVLTRIDAKFEDLKIGIDVEISFIEATDNYIVHQFKPVT